MRRKLCTFIACCMLASVCHGQEMSLRECIKTGIANNLSLANARINIAKGRTGVTQNRSRLLPAVNGVIQFTDYLKNPVNVTTGTRLGSDFPDAPVWQTIKSMQYNASAGVMLSMPLYDQTLLAATDVAKTVERIHSLSYEKAVDDLTVQICKAYYLAQAAQEQERLTEENILRMKELCDITEALYQQGVVMEVDLNRVRINLKNLQAQQDLSETLRRQQMNMLRFLMDMNADAPLEVERMEEDLEPAPDNSVKSELPELLIQEQQRALAEKRIKAVRAGYLPTLSFTAYAGALGYQEKFRHFFHTSAATDNWFGNSYIGLAVRLPLFDANAKRLQTRQYKYDAHQAANSMEMTRKKLNEEYANATLQLSHNMEVLRTQSESRRQAEEVYNVTEEQYKEGVASMTALLQDEMQLRTSQTACVQALCQCRLARLDLLRLSGELTLLSK